MCLVGKYTFDIITLCEYVNHCFQQQQNYSENNNVKTTAKKQQSFCVKEIQQGPVESMRAPFLKKRVFI